MYTNIRYKHTLAQYITSRMIRYIYNQSLHCVLKITIWLVFLMYSFGEMRFSGHSFRIKDFSRVQMWRWRSRARNLRAHFERPLFSSSVFVFRVASPFERLSIREKERERECGCSSFVVYCKQNTEKRAFFLRHWSKNSNGPTASLNKGNKEIRDEIIKLNLQKTHKPRIGQDYDPLRTEIVIWWKKSARSWPKRR